MKNLFLTLIVTMLATQVMSFDVTIEDDYSYPQNGEYDYGLTSEDIGLSNPNPSIGESVTITAQIHNSGLCFARGIFGWNSPNGRSAWAEWDFNSTVSETIDITFRCRDDVAVDWRVELDGVHLASPTVPGCGSGLHWKIVTIHDVPISAGSHTFFLGTYQMDYSPDYCLDWIQLGGIHIEAETYDRMGGNDPNPDYRGLRIYPMGAHLPESYNLTVQVWDGNPDVDGVLLYENFVGSINTVYDRWHCSPDNTITVQYIESGGQAAIECEWIPEEPGEHDIYVVIDPYEVLNEIDEANNIAHRNVVVGGRNQPNWEVISGTQYNMTVLASIELFGDSFVAGGNNLGAAFGPDGENECRALAAGQDNLWSFTIVSNATVGDEEVISFKIYDSNSNTVYVCNETIQFSDNSTIGSPAEPLCLTISGRGIDAPEGFILSQNHPNPYTVKTEISFSLATASKVKLSVYGHLGREICVLTDKYMEAGSHKVEFRREDLHTGIYYYRLEVKNNNGTLATTRKLLIVPK